MFTVRLNLVLCLRTLASFQHIEIVDLQGHRRILNRRYSLQQLFMWGICPSTQLKSKYMSCSLGLVKSRRLSWDWISTAKHLVAFVLLCMYLFIKSQHHDEGSPRPRVKIPNYLSLDMFSQHFCASSILFL